MTPKIASTIAVCALFFLPSPASAQIRIVFNGRMDLQQEEINMTLNVPTLGAQEMATRETRPILARINKTGDGGYRISLKFDHLRARSYDFSS